MKKNDINKIQTNHTLLNIITPITGIEYKQSRMRIGDNFAKIYTVIKYPKNIKVGWLAKLSNIPNTISVQLFEPSDNTLLIENMSRGIRQSEMIYDSSKDALVRKRALREIDDGQEIIDMACYKVLMGADGQNLQEMKILYKLTEAEEYLIYARQMGVALFMAGTSRLSVKFDIFPYEFEYFANKKGGNNGV